MRHLNSVWVWLAVFVFLGSPLAAQEIEVDAPPVFLSGVPSTITVRAPTSLDTLSVSLVTADGDVVGSTVLAPLGSYAFSDLSIESSAQLPLEIRAGETVVLVKRPLLPGIVSVLPPLVAITLALIFKEVVLSLFAGIWLGCLFLAGYNPLAAVLMVIGRFARETMTSSDHASIILFSLLLGGMVGILSKMGATRAIVDALAPIATTRKRGLLATWLAGLAIFFDDYANTLVVGNTMRPVTDRLRISREKLAYIVDSTAAPVAAIVFVSTWVGYEISLIADGFGLAVAQNSGNPAVVAGLQVYTPFGIFIQTIPYLFYPILAILMVALLIFMGRDFGPMLKAERRAGTGGGLFRPGAQLATDVDGKLDQPVQGKTVTWVSAVIPIVTLIVTVLAGLVRTGRAALEPGTPATLMNVFGGADPFTPLLWGSLFGCIAAVLLAVGQRILSLQKSVDALVGGMRAMILAIIILVLAWSLADVTNSLSTAAYLSQVLSDALPIELLPVTVFVVAGAISFATGTSWGTMAILLPLAIPLTVALGGEAVVSGGPQDHVLLSAIGAVLAGSIFGDHCSPISDTTVLSSMASGCDHVDHVRTQLPYALVVAGVGLVLGSLATAYGMPPVLSLLLGAAVIGLVIRFVGRKVEGTEPIT